MNELTPEGRAFVELLMSNQPENPVVANVYRPPPVPQPDGPFYTLDVLGPLAVKSVVDVNLQETSSDLYVDEDGRYFWMAVNHHPKKLRLYVYHEKFSKGPLVMKGNVSELVQLARDWMGHDPGEPVIKHDATRGCTTVKFKSNGLRVCFSFVQGYEQTM